MHIEQRTRKETVTVVRVQRVPLTVQLAGPARTAIMLENHVNEQLFSGIRFYKSVLQATATGKGHATIAKTFQSLSHPGCNLARLPRTQGQSEADTTDVAGQLLKPQEDTKLPTLCNLHQQDQGTTVTAAQAAQLHPSPGCQQTHHQQARGHSTVPESHSLIPEVQPQLLQWQESNQAARIALHDTSNVQRLLQRSPPTQYAAAEHVVGDLCLPEKHGKQGMPYAMGNLVQVPAYLRQQGGASHHQQPQQSVCHAQQHMPMLHQQPHQQPQPQCWQLDANLQQHQRQKQGLQQSAAHQGHGFPQLQQVCIPGQQAGGQQWLSAPHGQHQNIQVTSQQRMEPASKHDLQLQPRSTFTNADDTPWATACSAAAASDSRDGRSNSCNLHPSGAIAVVQQGLGNQHGRFQHQQQKPLQHFNLQRRQLEQQQRHEATNVRTRPQCKQLLRKLSLFVGEHQDGTEGKGDSSGNSSNKRWPWLASERKDAQGISPGSPGYDPSTLHIPATAWAAMTEFNKQFWSIKHRCMDLVLFVRHGSFYNLFDVDADVGLRVGLNISGVMTANMWKVLALGYNVGRVEEMPRAASGGGKLLTRQLVRIYTPGTAVDGLLADDLDHRANTILCITEMPVRSNSGSNSSGSIQHCLYQISATGSAASSSMGTAVGICVIDVSSGTCKAGAFSTAEDPARSALAAVLMVHDPVECVAVRNSLHPATVALLIRHCEVKGTAPGPCLDINCGGAKHTPGMSWLPCSSAATELQQPLQLLQQALTGQVLQQLQAVVTSNSSSVACTRGDHSTALLSSVAVAVHQLQRCSLSDDVVPTLEVATLDGLVKPAAQNPGAPLFLDDKAITVLDLLAPSSSCITAVDNRKAVHATAAAGNRMSNQAGSLLDFLDRAASPAGRRTLQQWVCRPLTLVSAIEERLDVLDLFRVMPDAAAALQQQLAALPDADRLLPKAATALRTLQQQQQQSNLLQQQQQGDQQGVRSALDSGAVADPADTVAVAARKAAWQALMNIPVCLMRLVQCLALLRGAALQKLTNTTQLPLLHRALIAASRASRPVKVLAELLEGAEWSEHAATAADNGDQVGVIGRRSALAGAAGASTGDDHSAISGGYIKLAAGADLAYDAASQQLQQVQQELQEELQQTLAAYNSSDSSTHHVLDTEAGQGVLYLITQPPGVGMRQYGSGRSADVQQQSASATWVQQLLLDDTHTVVHQEQLSDSKLAALVHNRGGTSAAEGAVAVGRGTRGRSRGRATNPRSRGHVDETAAAVAGDLVDEGLLVLHVHIPVLQQLAAQVQQAQQQVARATAAALDRAATIFLGSYSLFRSLVRSVSELDVLAGFAALVTEWEQQQHSCYCRPRFAAAGAAAATAAATGDSGASAGSPLLRFEGLWHPLLATSAAAAGGRVVCNDVQLGGSHPGAMVLTGANMGGKSTLLRSTCIAVIMAQIGCYVAARSALLEPVDAIFTRIGAADAIMCGRSTFMVEMTETAACLAAATPASLIVLDELGRGTSTHDGYALAYAVLTHLVQPQQHSTPGQQQQPTRQQAALPSGTAASVTVRSCKPRLLFATHYHKLTCESDLVGLIQCCHMATEWDESAGHLVHLYKLREGAAPAGSCGIEVAALAGLPSAVIQRATQVAAAIQRKHMAPEHARVPSC